MSKYILFFLCWGSVSLAYSQAPNWAVNSNDYQFVMTLLAKGVNDCQDATNTSDIIGVFDLDGNCRGKGNLSNSPTGYSAFINVYSNMPTETLYLRFYDATLNTVFNSYAATLNFVAGGLEGDASHPFPVIYDSNVVAHAGTDQLITNNHQTTLQATGTGFWTIFSGENGEIDDVNNPNATFTGELEETYVLTWTVEDNECQDEIDAVTIQFTTNSADCPLSHIISGNISEAVSYQASHSITANNVILTGAEVTYRAVDNITLNAGFEVALGAIFLAEINNCQIVGNEPIVENTIEDRSNSEASDNLFNRDKEEYNLSIYPNLIRHHHATVVFTLPTESWIDLSIINLNRKIIQNLYQESYLAAGEYRKEIELEQLPKGMYLLQLRTNHKVFIEKIIIQ